MNSVNDMVTGQRVNPKYTGQYPDIPCQHLCHILMMSDMWVTTQCDLQDEYRIAHRNSCFPSQGFMIVIVSSAVQTCNVSTNIQDGHGWNQDARLC